MQRVTLYEYGRLYAWDSPRDRAAHPVGVPRNTFERLRSFDRSRSKDDDKDTIFNWSPRDHAKARNWVGVLSIDDTVIEILPKIEASAYSTTGSKESTPRVEIIEMLHYAGVIKSRQRDLAQLTSSSAPLSELLIHLFSQRVKQEVGLGLPRVYREREEDLRVVRGRINVRRYIQSSLRNPTRIWCRFDDHLTDSPLAQLIRATCSNLLKITRTPRARSNLEDVHLLLSHVRDAPLTPELAQRVILNRTSARFEDIVSFCTLVAQGRSPDLRSGSQRSFSLLFPMESLYESFLEGFYRREIIRRDPATMMHAQGTGLGTYLVRNSMTNEASLRLKPDLWFSRSGTVVIMDAKWKVAKKNHGRPGREDLYQTYAYGARFGADVVVLLYPDIPGAVGRNYVFEGTERHLMTRYVSTRHRLSTREGRTALQARLTEILDEAFAITAPLGSKGRGGQHAQDA